MEKRYYQDNIERVLRKLICDSFLREELAVVSKMEIDVAYLRLKKNANDLLNFVIPMSKSGVDKTRVPQEEIILGKLGDQCYQELVEVRESTAFEKNSLFIKEFNKGSCEKKLLIHTINIVLYKDE
jgi:hypothetical protein